MQKILALPMHSMMGDTMLKNISNMMFGHIVSMLHGIKITLLIQVYELIHGMNSSQKYIMK